MKKILASFLALFIIFGNIPIPRAYASSDDNCTELDISVIEGVGPNETLEPNATSHTIKINAPRIDNTDSYRLAIYSNVILGGSLQLLAEEITDFETVDADGNLTFTLTGKGIEHSRLVGEVDPHHVYLAKGTAPIDLLGSYCFLGQYAVPMPTPTCSEPINIYQNRTINGETKQCYSNTNGCLVKSEPLYFELNGVTDGMGTPWEGRIKLNIDANNSITTDMVGGSLKVDNTFSGPGSFSVVPESHLGKNLAGACPAQSFDISDSCPVTDCNETPDTETPTGQESSFELCDQIENADLQAQCRTCATSGEGGSDGQGGVWTAVGCISRDPVSIARRFIEVGLGMGGGVALIMTLAGGFILSTSQGDPQKANQAKEMITNSVIGLLFVIFSVVILQFIGVTILRIPGFGADTEQASGS